MSMGLRLLGSLTQVQDLSRFDLGPELFLDGKELEAYEYVRAYATKYGALPSEEALDDHSIMLAQSTEPSEYHYDKLRDRYTHRTMAKDMTNASNLMNDKSYTEALGMLSAMCVALNRAANPNKILNYSQQGLEHVMTAYKASKAGEGSGILLGWETPDVMAGGLVGGDVATIVGRPGAGKTYMMLRAAIMAWMQGKVPMFVSMEMKPLPIMQRLAAMMVSLPISDLMAGDLPTLLEKKMENGLQELTGQHPFWIIDGALSSTIDEIVLQAQQLKPDIVFIDAAYLLRHPNQKLSRWDKATTVMEEMKAKLAEDMNIPVLNSHQLNREAEKKIKKGKADELGVEDIAYTDAVGQISSLVMALFQAESPSDVEIITTREVTIMKGRSGETGSFPIRWNFSQGPDWMDFSEVTKVKTADMQYN